MEKKIWKYQKSSKYCVKYLVETITKNIAIEERPKNDGNSIHNMSKHL